jgi:5-methylcytosine-specific restriction endonuclease McrA
MNTHACTKCGRTKPTSEFSPDRRTPKGFQSQCKACNTAHTKAYYRANTTKVLARQKERNQQRRINNDVDFLERQKTAQRKYYANHKQAKNARSKVWQSNNPDRMKAAYKRYRERHPEQVKAYNKAYGATHKALKSSLTMAWAKANPDRTRANGARRRARKADAPINDFTAKQWQEMKAHYGHKCVYCGRKMQRLTMDHITPLIHGGSHTLSNIVPACHSCNSRKGKGQPPKPVQPLLL